ncbi:MAG: 4'-phosphopantetheinyl transferase superfamily protein [bacterium]|nr:4'-phosphopantetheinyl transferase superfamily protein [bacterium]
MSGTPSRRPLAIGIDVTEVARVAGLIGRAGNRLGRVFTPPEQAAAPSRGRAGHLACCFAGKEAVFKALGRGWGQGLRWNEITITGGRARPWRAELRGAARRRLAEMGGARVELSVSACEAYALARAVVLG